ELTHRGQLVNIKKLVQTAKDERRNIIVTGYADSQTGNQQLNERLSAQRADTIVKELLEMGVDAKNIKIVIGGGVDILRQVPANRRVVVSLDE
ncbi:MAG: OmpA family protein, partial [Prevotella sp.]|nr:OmpA family protein [Prevotella sp.]